MPMSESSGMTSLSELSFILKLSKLSTKWRTSLRRRHYLFVAPLAWFSDPRCQELIEHEVKTLIGQRVFGLGLGYEDLNDHDEALTGSAPP